MTETEVVDALAEVDPCSSDDGWTNCFFCLAMIESGHEQHNDGCLWVAARKLRGLPYVVEVPVREPRPPGRPPLIDTGSLKRSIVANIIPDRKK